MSDFGKSNIHLKPNDYEVPFRFDFSACSSPAANDGALPYGSSITGIAVTAEDAAGNAVNDLIASSSDDDEGVTVSLSYPAAGEGTYKLTFVVTLSGGTKIEFEYGRVFVKE